MEKFLTIHHLYSVSVPFRQKLKLVNGWVRRDFYVNGRRVHLVGGAWVPDMMLNRDSLRYDYELHLCRNANVNLVRIWGGGLGETDDFYEGADRYGLLVWQDFWITGDTHGGFKGSADWPLEGRCFPGQCREYHLQDPESSKPAGLDWRK